MLDGQGSVVALTDHSGTVVDGYVYDIWGPIREENTPGNIPQPLRYRGCWWDGWDNALSGSKDQGWDQGALPWYWLGPRAYDPNLERFLQPDPSARDGVRSYAYLLTVRWCMPGCSALSMLTRHGPAGSAGAARRRR